MKEKILALLREVEAIHPYRKSGDRDSYSSFNEGWSSAIDYIEQRLEVLFEQEGEKA